MNEPGNRVVVVTGAASGIGHATAELFRDLGDTVFGLDILPTVPEGVTYVECNVGDRDAVLRAVETCAVQGRIDVRRLCAYWRTRGAARKFGLGFYSPTEIHVDTSGFRTWGEDYHRGSSLCMQAMSTRG